MNEYDVLFDIYYENKKFVSMNCPISDWYDQKKGYTACIKQMCDMIDGYVELNNAFNLIIYIDLPENEEYSSIPRDEYHDKVREECNRAMHILYTHVVSESIVADLASSGRMPQSVLLMFGEEKQFLDFSVPQNDPRRNAVMNRVLGFLGLPSSERIEEVAKEIDAGTAEDKVAAFQEKIGSICTEGVLPGIRRRYRKEFELWCEELMNEGDVEKANASLFDSIEKINKIESDRVGIERLSCHYDRFACSVNRSVCALSELNIALHLLKCIEAESVFEPGTAIGSGNLMQFQTYSLEEIAPILKSKSNAYLEKVSEIESRERMYTDPKLGLAPPLKEFDHSKFGLDAYGEVETELVVRDVVQEENDKADEEDETAKTDESDSENLQIKGDSREVSVVEKESRNLFPESEYKPLDTYCRLERRKVLRANAKPEDYIEYAKKLRKHHLDYLNKTKRHITEVLSNYAGKSKQNKPALLQMGGYRYSTGGDSHLSLETAEDVAESAYRTMFSRFMEFCAARSVALTDIEEQCNWFVTRIGQIERSLKLLKRVAIGVGIGTLVLYVPYIIIQFEAIFKDISSIAAALLSLGVPVAVLYTVFGVLAALQRKKYDQACEKFEKKSDEVLAQNSLAVEKFDALLAKIIPGLRWVYEYMLDVLHCSECCSVADAKIIHHRMKLHERATAISNILRDLEVKESDAEKLNVERLEIRDAVDYNVPFCSGKKNCAFYAVIDKSILDEFKR